MTADFNSPPNPLGKLPGSVWEIPTQPLTVPDWYGVVGGCTVQFFTGRTPEEAWIKAVAWQRHGTRNARRSVRPMADHYAAFPIEWPRRIIAGWSPPGICTACGQGRRPVADVTRVPHYAGGSKGRTPGVNHGNPGTFDDERIRRTNPVYTLTGYACACPDTTAPTTPSVILDPFGGTGTTALAAKAAGRHGITIDMSADYCRLAEWRTTDPGQLAAAMQVDKPAPVAPDQLDLLEGLLDLTPAVPDRPRGGLAYANAHGRTCGACGYRSQYATAPQCEKCGAEIERTA